MSDMYAGCPRTRLHRIEVVNSNGVLVVTDTVTAGFAAKLEREVNALAAALAELLPIHMEDGELSELYHREVDAAEDILAQVRRETPPEGWKSDRERAEQRKEV